MAYNVYKLNYSRAVWLYVLFLSWQIKNSLRLGFQPLGISYSCVEWYLFTYWKLSKYLLAAHMAEWMDGVVSSVQMRSRTKKNNSLKYVCLSR